MGGKDLKVLVEKYVKEYEEDIELKQYLNNLTAEA